MEETKNVKALKKQLAAAIAMVCVAAVALGSSTYAWFVSNNSVDATISTISAQSNAPFLKITSGTGTITEATGTSYSYGVGGNDAKADKALFPVQVTAWTADAITWQSAYASNKGASTENTATRFTVKDADKEKYYLLEEFKIGTDGTTEGTFKNLRVADNGVKLVNTENSELDGALRLLVVCGENAVILDGTGTVVTTATGAGTITGVKTAANAPLADTIGKGESKNVKVYAYYDGADQAVRTDNLAQLKAIAATITFTADDAAAN